MNEFNPLFLQEGLNAQFFGSLGESGAYGEQAILTGLEGPVSFAVSQLASWTDGIRANNDDDVEQFDGFVQAQLGSTSSAQLEISHSEREYGDVLSAFDPEFFSPAIRNSSEIDIQRLGFRHVINVKSDLLISVVRQERLGTVDVPDPFFPTLISNDQDGWKFEAQYLASLGDSKFVAGVAYSDGRNEFEVTSVIFPVFRPIEPHHYSAYGYWYMPSPGKLPEIQLGLSLDDMSSEIGDQSEVSPKLGLVWSPTDNLTVRASGFRVLKQGFTSAHGLEPTQLAGFNQFYDDPNGAISEGAGIGIEYELTRDVTVGGQYSRRKIEAPFLDFSGIHSLYDRKSR